MDTMEIEVNLLQDKNATVVEVTLDGYYTESGEEVVATGSAKREVGEKFNSSVGVSIALARALRNLANTLEGRVEEQTGWKL